MDINLGRLPTGQDAEPRKRAKTERIGTEWTMPDAQTLAQDYVTIWQSELLAIGADPELRETWTGLVNLWAGILNSVDLSAPAGPQRNRDERPARGAGSPDAPRSASSDATPDARDAEIARLSLHVASLEQRLAELERGLNSGDNPKRRRQRTT